MQETAIRAGLFLRNPVAASTHLFWALLAIWITALFWQLTRGDPVRRWSLMTFGISLCLLYSASGIYHSLRISARPLNFFRLLDHSMIYVLIAGTYTPMVMLILKGWFRLSQLILIWSIALVGIVCKWTLPAPPYPVNVGIYVGMGWIGLLSMPHLIQAVGVRGMAWVLMGGILYTLGGVCDAICWPIFIPGVVGHHEVLHVLDMFASLAHVYFVIRYILPYSDQPPTGTASLWVRERVPLPRTTNELLNQPL